MIHCLKLSRPDAKLLYGSPREYKLIAFVLVVSNNIIFMNTKQLQYLHEFIFVCASRKQAYTGLHQTRIL